MNNSLLIAGDLVPTKTNFDLFRKANIIELLGAELFALWNSAENRIFNLEVPLADKENPIIKCGPNLAAPTSAIFGIKALNPSLITLANNHILDQGFQGIESTMRILKENVLPYVGAGKNLSEATKPHIFFHCGMKVGVYACAEHEFSIATENMVGANPFDPFESLDHINHLKSLCDYVIVLYHGGKEHYRYPSPNLQKACRKMVQKGADLVICQHSHCIGCFEMYEDSTIIYGQGNFIFDRSKNDFWKTSLLIKVTFENGICIDYIPIVKIGNGVRLAKDQTAENILASFYQRSKEILQNGFIERKYQEFAENNILFYFRHFAGLGKWLSMIDRIILKGMLVRWKYSQMQVMAIRNYIECEAHRELILAVLRSDKKKVLGGKHLQK